MGWRQTVWEPLSSPLASLNPEWDLTILHTHQELAQKIIQEIDIMCCPIYFLNVQARFGDSAEQAHNAEGSYRKWKTYSMRSGSLNTHKTAEQWNQIIKTAIRLRWCHKSAELKHNVHCHNLHLNHKLNLTIYQFGQTLLPLLCMTIGDYERKMILIIAEWCLFTPAMRLKNHRRLKLPSLKIQISK